MIARTVDTLLYSAGSNRSLHANTPLLKPDFCRYLLLPIGVPIATYCTTYPGSLGWHRPESTDSYILGVTQTLTLSPSWRLIARIYG